MAGATPATFGVRVFTYGCAVVATQGLPVVNALFVVFNPAPSGVSPHAPTGEAVVLAVAAGAFSLWTFGLVRSWVSRGIRLHLPRKAGLSSRVSRYAAGSAAASGVWAAWLLADVLGLTYLAAAGATVNEHMQCGFGRVRRLARGDRQRGGGWAARKADLHRHRRFALSCRVPITEEVRADCRDHVARTSLSAYLLRVRAGSHPRGAGVRIVVVRDLVYRQSHRLLPDQESGAADRRARHDRRRGNKSFGWLEADWRPTDGRRGGRARCHRRHRRRRTHFRGKSIARSGPAKERRGGVKSTPGSVGRAATGGQLPRGVPVGLTAPTASAMAYVAGRRQEPSGATP